MTSSAFHLRPLEAADLPSLRAWFDDLETQRWIGGPDWAEQALKLADPLHGRHVFLAELDGSAVGLLDVERYAGGQASFAVVTAPLLRRRGIGRLMINAAQSGHAVGPVGELFAGVEVGNDASAGLLRRCGFVLVREADEDGFCYFAWRPGGRMIEDWRIEGGQS